MKRTFGPVFLTLVLVGCTSNSAQSPLGPSGIGAGNTIVAQAGAANQVSWACLTEPGAECGAAGAGAQLSSTPAPVAGPINIAATVTGSTVILSWQPPPGVTPTGYVIEAGSATGRSDIAVFIFLSTATSLTVNNVPNNVYFVRLRAIVDNCCATDPSNEIVVTVGQPPAPCNLTLSPTTARAPAAGGTVSIAVTANCAWTAITNSPFLTITSGSSGTGNGTVVIAVSRNTAGNRSGTVTIAGQAVTINQDASTLVAAFELWDTATQVRATTECRFKSAPTTCQMRSTSFTFGRNAIVSYQWTLQYTYGTVKTLTQTDPSPNFSFSDNCGGEGATADGAAQPLSVTLTVVDNNGDTATAVAGTDNQPPLVVRLFTCP